MALFTNKDAQAGQPKNINVGQVTGVRITGTMTGYVDGSALTIGAPPGGGVQAVGTIVVVAGRITGIVLTNPGAGYTSAPTVTAATGTGATLTATVAKIEVPNNEVVFVSREEAVLVGNRLKGIHSPGWYRIQEKLRNDGTITYKSECLVAMSVTNAVAGDAKGDDLVVGDVNLVITTQPANLTKTLAQAAAASTFTVVATGGSTYQWQVQAGGTGAYANLANSGVYTTATTATLNISNTTGLGENRYRCVVGAAAGAASTTSRGATLTQATV
jgi:hypothetical protein